MRERDAIHSVVHIRPAAVAGTFYPTDPGRLRQDIDRYLRDAGSATEESAVRETRPLKALIAPHAGYPYSGPVAGSAYNDVRSLRGKIKRVILIGPAHRVPVTGLATTSASAFDTPLGAVPVDLDVCGELNRIPGVHVHDAAHAPEHGLEVHLPFLIHTLGNVENFESVGFSIVPLLFGDTGWELIAQVLDLYFDDGHNPDRHLKRPVSLPRLRQSQGTGPPDRRRDFTSRPRRDHPGQGLRPRGGAGSDRLRHAP